MATVFFLRNEASGLGGAGVLRLSQRRGRAAVTTTTTTTAGGTNIQITATAGGQALTWISEPVTSSFSVVATNNFESSLRLRESATSVNAGLAVQIERTDGAGVVQATLRARTVGGTEAGTTESARTIQTSGAATTFAVGDRIKLTLSVGNLGTMGAGTFNTYHAGPAAAASGDSFIRFVNNDFVTDEIVEVGASERIGGGIYG